MPTAKNDTCAICGVSKICAEAGRGSARNCPSGTEHPRSVRACSICRMKGGTSTPRNDLGDVRLMVPPNRPGDGGICRPSMVVVTLCAPGVPLMTWADAPVPPIEKCVSALLSSDASFMAVPPRYPVGPLFLRHNFSCAEFVFRELLSPIELRRAVLEERRSNHVT